jgi:hypothetical protein
MTVQPTQPGDLRAAPRVPRTIDGIAEALTGAARMAFYREIGQADAGSDLQDVLAAWWGQAMLDTDPARAQLVEAVEAGTLPTVTMESVVARRRANGGAMPGE